MTGGRPAIALAALLAGAAVAITPATADPASDCQQSADSDLAIEGCTQFLETASGEQIFGAYFFRGAAYLAKHDFYHAVNDFTAALNVHPSAEASFNRGISYVNQMADDPAFADLALADMNQALAVKSDLDAKPFSLAYAQRAATNLANEQDAQAVADEDSAVRLNPEASAGFKAEFAQAYVARAWKRLAGADYDRAAADFRQAVELDPTSSAKLGLYVREAEGGQPGPYSAMAKGFQAEEDGSFASAADYFTEAIQANPKLAEAYVERQNAYQALGRLDEARADLDRAIELEPNDWNAHYLSGKLYDTAEQFDQASRSYRQASLVIDRVHDAGFDAEKAKVADAVKLLEFHRKLNDHWASYLKQIQLSNNYPNWSAPPYDLYAERHALPKLPPPAVAPAPAAEQPSPPASPFGKFLVPLLVLLALLAGAWFIRQRRRHRAT